MTPEQEREELRGQLQDIGQGTLVEWMRLVDLEDVAGIGWQGRLRWQQDGAVELADADTGEEIGRYRITVKVEELPLLPPLGPESEPELVWVLRTWHDVRAGDTVRLPGTEHVTTIIERYWPPQPMLNPQLHEADPHVDVRAARAWHVVPGQEGHWQDHVVKVRPDGKPECVVVLGGETRPRFMDPLLSVEIQMDAATAALLDGGIGTWADRI
jgi:hypothetical protein